MESIGPSCFYITSGCVCVRMYVCMCLYVSMYVCFYVCVSAHSMYSFLHIYILLLCIYMYMHTCKAYLSMCTHAYKSRGANRQLPAQEVPIAHRLDCAGSRKTRSKCRSVWCNIKLTYSDANWQMHISLHVHLHVMYALYKFSYNRSNVYMCMLICASTDIQTHVHTHMYIYMFIYIYVCMHICTYRFVNRNTEVCIYLYAHT